MKTGRDHGPSLFIVFSLFCYMLIEVIFWFCHFNIYSKTKDLKHNFMSTDLYKRLLIPAGLLKHSLSIAKTYLADVTSPLERPQVLGTFNAASSLGFVVGPIIGGHVSMLENGFFKVAALAALGMFLDCIFVFLFVEDEHKQGFKTGAGGQVDTVSVNNMISSGVLNNDEELTTQKNDTLSIHENTRSNESVDGITYRGKKLGEDCPAKNGDGPKIPSSDQANSWLSKRFKLLKVASVSSVMDLLLIRFIMGLSMMIFRSNFSSMLEFRYQTTPKTIGYIISFNGLVGGFSGVLVGKLSRFYKNDAKMLLHFSFLLTASILCITLSPDIWMLPVFIIPLAISSAVSRVCITNITFKRGKEDEKGVLLGLGNSLLSFGRMLSPIIGGFAQEFSVYGSGLIAVGTALAGISVMLISPQDKDVKKQQVKKRE